jgi:Holliday junction resolvase
MGHPGANFERTVAEHYRKQGYRTMRSWGSLGIWDLLCFKKVEILGPDLKELFVTHVVEVQVKGKSSDPFTDEDKANLKKHAEEIGAEAHYAYGKRMPLKKPIGRRRLQAHRTVIIENLSASVLGSMNVYEST